jgi:3D (Asp-Asp-Asp) domain-containing protein
MFTFLGRGLCGALILLVTLANGGHSFPNTDNTEPASPPSPMRAGASSLDSALAQPPVEYQQKPAYRVYRVTAYCDRGLTAAGVPSGIGQCAAPADIPFGARLYIPALKRTFVVTDRTAKRFRHNTVDLFIPDRAECLSFGRRYLECAIRLPVERVRYGSPRLSAALAAVRR